MSCDSPNLQFPLLGVEKPRDPVDEEEVGAEGGDRGPSGHLNGGEGQVD